jgi:hypothetical protein
MAGHRSPRASTSRVEPSMSVNRNVTVPVGRSVTVASLFRSLRL